jgi:hypothetical protein
MTSFCRRVIAMRMIVANKKRIASFFVQAARSLMTYLIQQWRVPSVVHPLEHFGYVDC